MKSFTPLIRLRKHELDIERRALTALEEKAEDIVRRRQALDDEYADETARARGDVEASYVIGDYIGAVRLRRLALDAEDAELAQQIALAEAKVRDAFRELKRFELADARQQTRVQKAALDREQAMLDEVALSGFRRQADGQA
jgi:flagellar FliJ protein